MKQILGSMVYRMVRKIALYRHGQDLEDVVVKGDKALATIDQRLNGFPFQFPIPKVLETEFLGLKFPSPLIFSSFKDDLDILSIWLNLGMGGGLFKTITKEAREGNERPRLLEVEVNGSPHLFNAMGLPGKGLHGLIDHISHHPINQASQPLGFSLAGSSVNDIVTLTKNLIAQRGPAAPWFIEINLSCPNTDEGQNLLERPDLVQSLLKQLRSITDKVIGIKVSPDQPDAALHQFGDVVESIDRCYVNCGNTSKQRCEDLGLESNAISIGTGGLSGPSLFERTCQMVSLFAEHKIPVIATGGIHDVDSVMKVLSRGAGLAAMATALVQDPYRVPAINQQLLFRRSRHV